MKTYRAVMVEMVDPENPHETFTATAMDLVNINDEDDRLMAGEDEFYEGEIVTEDDIVMEDHSYVYDDGVGVAPFAMRKIK